MMPTFLINVYEADYIRFTHSQRNLLFEINRPSTPDLRIHRLHAFAIVELGDYPEGHPKHGLGDWERAFWIRQFGRDRGHNKERKVRNKGIVRIRIPLVGEK